MLLQSPPFWCLMTTQELIITYDIMMRSLDLQKLDGAPPTHVHIMNMYLNTNTHVIETSLPLVFTSQAHMQHR